VGYKYLVVRSTYLSGREWTSYGIAVTEEEEEQCVLRTLADLSPSVELIQKLVRRCNQLRLDPIHLEEIIEDLWA